MSDHIHWFEAVVTQTDAWNFTVACEDDLEMERWKCELEEGNTSIVNFQLDK